MGCPRGEHVLDSTSHVSRRAFLMGASAAAVAAAVPFSFAASAFAATPSNVRVPGGVAGLTRSTFVPLVGDTFRMAGGPRELDVVLAAIGDLAGATPRDAQRMFSLEFSAAKSGYRDRGGIRTLSHPEVSDITLYVGPTDRGVVAARYQAVINSPSTATSNPEGARGG